MKAAPPHWVVPILVAKRRRVGQFPPPIVVLVVDDVVTVVVVAVMVVDGEVVEVEVVIVVVGAWVVVVVVGACVVVVVLLVVTVVVGSRVVVVLVVTVVVGARVVVVLLVVIVVVGARVVVVVDVVHWSKLRVQLALQVTGTTICPRSSPEGLSAVWTFTYSPPVLKAITWASVSAVVEPEKVPLVPPSPERSSGTSTGPATPRFPWCTCAAIAGPLRFCTVTEYVSVLSA